MQTSKLLYFGYCANIFVLTGVLCGSLYIQLVLNEFPCPLCMLQRMAMILCALSLVYMLSKTLYYGYPNASAVSVSNGLNIVSSLVGASISIRQILLHIMPSDPGYGDAILGFHIYTWALIVFICEIAFSAGVMLLNPNHWDKLPLSWHKPIKVLFYWLAIVVVIFLLATFNEEGFNWVLPDNPTENAFINF
ncbi:MAG TPA: disulfide bond formation protein B [Candidatus Enterocola sp.]|jgi:disulfide bond formation protein DsbB|nr:disulfide bond formation protein B [Candidatus Enterocola sp.]HPG55307.1 disulfide bond formation protein B [Candidatus Enterocola sp.]